MPTYWDSFGILKYSPKMLGEASSPNWWVILEADPGIGKYLRQLFYLSRWKVEKLQRPAWAAHISLLRNEEPSPAYKHLWGRFENQELSFRIWLDIQSNGDYYWVPVYCQGAEVLRSSLGLRRLPEIPFHLSFGRTV